MNTFTAEHWWWWFYSLTVYAIVYALRFMMYCFSLKTGGGGFILLKFKFMNKSKQLLCNYYVLQVFIFLADQNCAN